MSKNPKNNIISSTDIQLNIASNSTIVVGLSGGPDSVCLLHMLAQLKSEKNLTLIAAHLDHGWRAESSQDRAWCQQLCHTLNVPFESCTAQELEQPKYNGSKEDLGRKLRRTFFNTIAQKYNADFIALAHHHDDQIETFFIRLLRGSSVQGLSGIKAIDGQYIRPLLHVSKQQILQYLGQHNMPYLIDSTNTDNTFLRNRIRNHLVPALQSTDERWSTSMGNTIAQLQSVQDFLQQHTMLEWSRITHTINTTTYVQTAEFLKLHPIMAHQILLKLMIDHNVAFTPTSSLFSEIIRFIASGKAPKHCISNTGTIIKDKNSFYFQTL